MATHSSPSVWLVGKPVKDIICSGLPTKLNVLKTLMYYHLEECKTVDESAKLAIQSTLTYWEKAHIPVQRHMTLANVN